MKFGIVFANVGPFVKPEGLSHLAKTAEDFAFESLWTVEHVVVPVGYDSRYPYSETGKMPGNEDSPIPDPLLPLAFAAANTNKIKLGTGIMILPQRHPAYVAKELATLDHLSNGRALFGVGIGWLQEEFDTLGVPFKERAARTEESIQAIRSLWKGQPAPFKGKFYSWDPVHSQPTPVQKNGVPILIGGHSKASAKRAARLGNGFFPIMGNDRSELKKLLDVMREECSRIGRDPSEIEITTGASIKSPDDVKRYADLGVSRMVIPPPAFDPKGIRDKLGQFHDTIIQKL